MTLLLTVSTQPLPLSGLKHLLGNLPALFVSLQLLFGRDSIHLVCHFRLSGLEIGFEPFGLTTVVLCRSVSVKELGAEAL